MSHYLTIDRGIGSLLATFGFLLSALGHQYNNQTELAFGVPVLLIGLLFIAGYSLKGIKFPGGGGIDVERTPLQLAESAPRKELPEKLKEERRVHAENLPIPGLSAPAFNLLSDGADLGAMPVADPMVPM